MVVVAAVRRGEQLEVAAIMSLEEDRGEGRMIRHNNEGRQLGKIDRNTGSGSP